MTNEHLPQQIFHCCLSQLLPLPSHRKQRTWPTARASWLPLTRLCKQVRADIMYHVQWVKRWSSTNKAKGRKERNAKLAQEMLGTDPKKLAQEMLGSKNRRISTPRAPASPASLASRVGVTKVH